MERNGKKKIQNHLPTFIAWQTLFLSTFSCHFRRNEHCKEAPHTPSDTHTPHISHFSDENSRVDGKRTAQKQVILVNVAWVGHLSGEKRHAAKQIPEVTSACLSLSPLGLCSFGQGYLLIFPLNSNYARQFFGFQYCSIGNINHTNYYHNSKL